MARLCIGAGLGKHGRPMQKTRELTRRISRSGSDIPEEVRQRREESRRSSARRKEVERQELQKKAGRTEAYHMDRLVVRLEKEAGEPLGLQIAQREQAVDVLHLKRTTLPHAVITAMKPDGVAARSGKLSVGDVIVAINGVEIHSDKKATELLHFAEGEIVEFTLLHKPKLVKVVSSGLLGNTTVRMVPVTSKLVRGTMAGRALAADPSEEGGGGVAGAPGEEPEEEIIVGAVPVGEAPPWYKGKNHLLHEDEDDEPPPPSVREPLWPITLTPVPVPAPALERAELEVMAFPACCLHRHTKAETELALAAAQADAIRETGRESPVLNAAMSASKQQGVGDPMTQLLCGCCGRR